MEDELCRRCEMLQTALESHELAAPFQEPVDPVALGVPNYFEIITDPMDLHTMRNKLCTRTYLSPKEYIYDMQLMFQNAIQFNEGDTRENSVGEMAKRMLYFGLDEYEKLFGTDEKSPDWGRVLQAQARERTIARARDARMVPRWKKYSFVARMNREKREKQLAAVADNTTS